MDAEPRASSPAQPRVLLQPAARRVLVDGEPARLGARAFDLLQALSGGAGQVVAKRDLLERVWPGVVVEENNLQVQVCALRKLLGAQAIVTVPGRGYALAIDVQLGESRAPSLSPGASGPARPPLACSFLPLRGREAELRSLRELVRSHRLVTVAGPGGVGKTRLAQAVAADVRKDFDDAPITAEAAAVGPRGSVAACIGRAVAPGSTDRSAGELAAWAGHRRLLLVVENPEHVTASARDTIATLLQGTANLHVLVTSQVPLQLGGEHVFRLAPLPVPPANAGPDAADAPAMQLLLDAVDAATPGRTFDDPELHDAAAICRHLDGLPLALELAAARVPMFGLAGVRRLLPERLHMLVAGSRGTSPRERSLLGCLEWGWQMLTVDERTAAGALAASTGTFSLRAARRMLAGAGFDGWRAMEVLDRLVAKSFVLAEGSDPPHFRVLESTRLFTAQHVASRAALPDGNTREHRTARR